VHLSIDRKKAAVSVDHRQGVVVDGLVFLEYGNYYDQGKLTGKAGKGFSGRARDALGQVLDIYMIPLGKVVGSVQLGQTYYLCSLLCGCP